MDWLILGFLLHSNDCLEQTTWEVEFNLVYYKNRPESVYTICRKNRAIHLKENNDHQNKQAIEKFNSKNNQSKMIKLLSVLWTFKVY